MKNIKKAFNIVPEKILNRTFIVGGSVRDAIMGIKPNDFDFVVVGSTPEEMLSLGFEIVGKSFPVFLHPITKDEFALARTEKSTGKGYHDFQVFTDNVTLEEDLKRRDLTINAIAIDFNGNFIDPFGGIKDIKNKKIKAVSNAFADDPLRVLRAVRFAAKFNFQIDKETIKLITKIKNDGMLNTLSRERIKKEIDKIMKFDNAYRFFEMLTELDLNFNIFNKTLWEMEQTEHFHRMHLEGSVLSHSILVIKEVSKMTNDPIAKWGALFHDIAKPISIDIQNNFHKHTNEKLVKQTIELLDKEVALTKEIKEVIFMAATTHHKFHNFFNLKDSTKIKLLLSFKDVKQLERVVLISKADALGRVWSNDDNMLSIGFKKASQIIDNKIRMENIFKGEDELPDVEFFIQLFKKLKAVSVKDFINNKNKKNVNAIKQELLRRRIKVLREFLLHHNTVKAS